MRWVLCLAIVAALSLTGRAQASIQQASATDATTQTAYAASTTDLINQGQPTLLSQTPSGYNGYNGASTAALNDGGVGLYNTNPGTAVDLDGVWSTVFTLNTSANTSGYDITQIATIGGWHVYANSQRYDVWYNTAANSTFVSLGTFSINGGSPAQPGGSSKITLTDSTGVIARWVKQLRFDVHASPDPFHVYREFDVIGTASSTAAPRLNNGGFESPALSSSFQIYNTAGPGPDGWTVGAGGGVLWKSTSGILPASGLQAFTPAGLGTNSSISQPLDTIGGQLYLVSFDWSGISDTTGYTTSMDVNVAGTTHSYSKVTSGGNFNTAPYSHVEFLFTATGTTSLLEFVQTQTHLNQYYGAIIDNVTVELAPEPGTLALVLSGAFGLGVLALCRVTKRRSETR